MQKLIAVDNIFDSDGSMTFDKVKKNALVFDHIAITLLDETEKILTGGKKNRDKIEPFLKEMEVLKSQKIIVDPLDLQGGRKINRAEHPDKMELVKDLVKKTVDAFHEFPEYSQKSQLDGWWLNYNYTRQRMDAIALQILLKKDLVFPLVSEICEIPEAPTTKHDAYQLVLNNLPMPSQEVSWEQIIAFRNDPDSKRKFLALRVWVSKISRSGISLCEVEEELKHLLADYEHHFSIHKMKYEYGTLQTIVMGIAEIAENIATLKFSKAAEIPFKLFQKNLELMEGEAKLPGQEIAYLFKANQVFKK